MDKEENCSNWVPSDGESGCSPPDAESPLNKALSQDRPLSSASGINGSNNWTVRPGMSSQNTLPHQSSFERQQQGKRPQMSPQGIAIPKPRMTNNSPPQLSSSPNSRRGDGSPINQSSWGAFKGSIGTYNFSIIT